MYRISLRFPPSTPKYSYRIVPLVTPPTKRKAFTLLHLRPSQPSQLTPLVVRSSSEGTLAVVVFTALLTGSIVLYKGLKPTQTAADVRAALEVPKEAEELAIMIGAPLPGRPGNLTSEQEEKLKEFWAAVLHVFGVPQLVDGTDASETSPTAQKVQATISATEKKSKKSRGGLFSKKKDEKTVAGGADGAASADGEDKYGQVMEFQKVLEDSAPEDLRKAFWSMVKHDNPDGLLLRFLRARKWNIQNALVMLIATMHWRMQEMKVDEDIVKRGEAGAAQDGESSNAAVKKEGQDFLAQMRMGKSFLHGSDKEGRPMCFVRCRLHKQGEQSETSLERYTVYTIETARLLLSGNIDTAVRGTFLT